MKRYGMVIGVKPERLDDYRREHAAVWPRVLEMISNCNIKNYSIYHHEGLLFSYFEYHGTDFDADMKKMADDPITQEWWKITIPMQDPVVNRQKGDWWSEIEEVFHHE